MFRKITLAAAVAAVLFAANLQAETLDTRIGKLEFTHDFANGYPTDATVKKLFDEIAPRYVDRPGGYTRMLRIGVRKGDAAEMVLLELVEEA